MPRLPCGEKDGVSRRVSATAVVREAYLHEHLELGDERLLALNDLRALLDAVAERVVVNGEALRSVRGALVVADGVELLVVEAALSANHCLELDGNLVLLFVELVRLQVQQVGGNLLRLDDLLDVVLRRLENEGSVVFFYRKEEGVAHPTHHQHQRREVVRVSNGEGGA